MYGYYSCRCCGNAFAAVYKITAVILYTFSNRSHNTMQVFNRVLTARHTALANYNIMAPVAREFLYTSNVNYNPTLLSQAES